jgi:hypothetical protein
MAMVAKLTLLREIFNRYNDGFFVWSLLGQILGAKMMSGSVTVDAKGHHRCLVAYRSTQVGGCTNKIGIVDHRVF